jgi:hypothetical protein
MGAPSVEFKQTATAPRISASPQGLTAVVKYRVAWEDAFTFTNEIMGILDGQPWQWPSSPNMRAYNADIEPIGLVQNVANQTKSPSYGSSPGEFYEFAIVTVTFGSQAVLATMPFTGDTINIPPADQFDPANPIEMSSYQVTYGTEMIKIPGGALKWSGFKADGSVQVVPADVRPPDSGSAYYRVPTFDLNLTMHNYLRVDYSVVRDKIGKLNDTVTFTNCDIETLLLNGLQTTRREMSDGVAILDVTLNYKWRSIGWNVTLGNDGEFYDYVRTTDDRVYPTTDIRPFAVLPTVNRWKPYNFNGIPGR